MPQPSERLQNYTPGRHAWERLQARTTASGWPARWAARILGPLPVRLSEHDITVAAPASPPLRLAFASDFHAGPTTHPELLSRTCALLEQVKPDLLLLGGDFVCLNARYIDALAEQLETLSAPLGKYAVLGNHDLWVDYPYIEQRLEAAGVELLTNRNVRLSDPFDHIWICGLDDHWYGRPAARAAVKGAEGVRIVLVHQPSSLLDLADERFELALCGHTHGGQVALPGGFPLVVPEGKLSRKYARGVHEVAPGSTLIVSRGVGCSTIPFRAFSPPEVLLCTVRSDEGASKRA